MNAVKTITSGTDYQTNSALTVTECNYRLPCGVCIMLNRQCPKVDTPPNYQWTCAMGSTV